MTNNKKRNFAPYLALWIFGCLLFFPFFFFVVWKNKINKDNKQILLIQNEMANICGVYHKKYIALLESEVKKENNEPKSVFSTSFEKYCSFKPKIDNINSFLKLHKTICDHFLYSQQNNLPRKLKMDIVNLNDDFNNKISIYVLSINSKIIKNSYQYKRWPKNIFYSYLTKGKWIVWY